MRPVEWLHSMGVGVFPIKEGTKEPACRWTEFRCEDPTALQTYGVRLGQPAHDGTSLAVLDPDSRQLVLAVEKGQFEVPETRFMVQTKRGLHLYFRLPPVPETRPIPKFIRREGDSIEFRNRGQYVLGPGSVHPSGAIYKPIFWPIEWEEIPVFPLDGFIFNDGSVKGSLSGAGEEFELPEHVYEPERHEVLNSFIAHLVTSANGSNILAEEDGLRELRRVCYEFAQRYAAQRCVPPLPWDHLMESFFERSFRGAMKLRDRPPSEFAPTQHEDHKMMNLDPEED